MFHRFLPILSLLLISPLLAEYVSGSLASSMITILWLMAAMYGAGALLVRELAIRSGGGWAAIALLGAAYGFVEEGWLTQSLFNPDYLGLRLLDFGYVDALGTSLPWLLYVIGIHVVWSICMPIALAQSLFPARRHEPWLKPWGIALVAFLYVAADLAVRRFSLDATPFRATQGEQIAVGIIVALLIAGAWLVGRKPVSAGEESAPSILVLFLYGLLSSAVFVGIERFGRNVLHLSWQLVSAIMIALGFAVIGLALRWRDRRWTARQSCAPMAGAALVYTLSGFFTSRDLHGADDLPGHAVIVLVFLLLLGIAWFRTVHQD